MGEKKRGWKGKTAGEADGWRRRGESREVPCRDFRNAGAEGENRVPAGQRGDNFAARLAKAGGLW